MRDSKQQEVSKFPMPEPDILMARKSMRNFGFINCEELRKFHKNGYSPRCRAMKRIIHEDHIKRDQIKFQPTGLRQNSSINQSYSMDNILNSSQVKPEDVRQFCRKSDVKIYSGGRDGAPGGVGVDDDIFNNNNNSNSQSALPSFLRTSFDQQTSIYSQKLNSSVSVPIQGREDLNLVFSQDLNESQQRNDNNNNNNSRTHLSETTRNFSVQSNTTNIFNKLPSKRSNSILGPTLEQHLRECCSTNDLFLYGSTDYMDDLEQNQINNNNRKHSSSKPLKPTFTKIKEGEVNSNRKNNKISPSTRNIFYSEGENSKILNATNKKNQKLVTNSVSQPNFVEFLDNNLSVQQNKIINAADDDNKNLISDGIGQENRFVKKASDNTTVDNSEASKIDSHVPIQLEQFCSPMGSPPM